MPATTLYTHCPHCEGEGFVEHDVAVGRIDIGQVQRPCQACDGERKLALCCAHAELEGDPVIYPHVEQHCPVHGESEVAA